MEKLPLIYDYLAEKESAALEALDECSESDVPYWEGQSSAYQTAIGIFDDMFPYDSLDNVYTNPNNYVLNDYLTALDDAKQTIENSFDNSESVDDNIGVLTAYASLITKIEDDFR